MLHIISFRVKILIKSEYVDDHFKCRQYISGFTGSAGTFLAGFNEGWLWMRRTLFLRKTADFF